MITSRFHATSAAKLRRASRRLARHHGPLALGVGAGMLAGATLISAPPAARLATASAYIALALIVATLLVSPLAALRGRRVTASSDLRRDLGVWAGIVSLAHIGLGLWARFGAQAYAIGGSAAAPLVALGGLAGVLAAEIVLVLLALSNDAAVRGLGLPLWKRIQRLARWLPALVGAHGCAWLLLARRERLAAAALAALILAPLALRALSGPARRLQSRRKPAQPGPAP